MRASDRPRLCFVGHMMGRNPGYPASQGEFVADGLATDYPVICVSSALTRAARLREIVTTLLTRRRDIDVVVVNVFSGASFLVADVASSLARALGHRTVLWLHGGALPSFIERHPRWALRVLRGGHALVTPTRYLADAAAAHGLSARVIPNAIESESYPFRPRAAVSPRLFWMRSFHSLYNPQMAVRVLHRLRTAGSDATLVMAGQDKGLLGDVQRLADELGVASAIRYVGFLDTAGKVREASLADIYLNTNRVDNTPVSVLEACALGLPVVSTAVGGVPYLVTAGETALLVRDDDAAAMANAVQRLVREPALANRLSQNGRRLAEESSWRAVRPKWEALIDELRHAPASALLAVC